MSNVLTLRSLWIIWLVTALTLTTATQLRMPGMPLGPGEFMLFSWVGLSIFLNWTGHISFYLSSLSKILLLFWGISFICMVIGLLSTLVFEVPTFENTRNGIAFAFAACVSLLLAFQFPSHHWLKIGLAFFLVSSFFLLIQILLYLTGIQLGFDPSYAVIRMRGWSLNPNQLALWVVPLPFLGLHILTTLNPRGFWYFIFILSFLPVFIAGLLSLSDALVLSWVGSFAFLACIWVATQFFQPSHTLLKAAIIKFIIPVFILTISSFVLTTVYKAAIDSATDVYSDGGQGSDRLMVWGNGVKAIKQFPVFGAGPASHSGNTGPFQGREAHNTYIDWGMSTGLLGLISFLGLLFFCFRCTNNKNSRILTATLISLCLFGMFHFVLRQPVFWFYLVCIY